MHFITPLLLSYVCFQVIAIPTAPVPSEFIVRYFKVGPKPLLTRCPPNFAEAFLNREKVGTLTQPPTKVIPFWYSATNKTVAVKSVSVDLSQQEETPLEVDILSRFNFQGITPNVLCKFQTKTKKYYVMDMIPRAFTLEKTSLFFDPWTHNFFQRWADLSISLAKLVEKVNDHWVVHLNLQLDNILMTPQGRLYLVGFSKARKFSFFKNLPSQAKNIPEVQDNPQSYTFKSDIYLLGKVLGELYSSMRLLLIETVFNKGDPFLKDFYDNLMNAYPMEVIEMLVAKDPSQRPTTKQLIQSLMKYREAHANFPLLTKERKSFLDYSQRLLEVDFVSIMNSREALV